MGGCLHVHPFSSWLPSASTVSPTTEMLSRRGSPTSFLDGELVWRIIARSVRAWMNIAFLIYSSREKNASNHLHLTIMNAFCILPSFTALFACKYNFLVRGIEPSPYAVQPKAPKTPAKTWLKINPFCGVRPLIFIKHTQLPVRNYGPEARGCSLLSLFVAQL